MNAHDSETVSAGRRAGDSACSIPPQTIAQECLDVIRDWTPKLAKALKVVGLINIQYCVQDNNVRALAAAPTPAFPCCASCQALGAGSLMGCS
jgi:carbamoylphosphate synthase large subunit